MAEKQNKIGVPALRDRAVSRNHYDIQDLCQKYDADGETEEKLICRDFEKEEAEKSIRDERIIITITDGRELTTNVGRLYDWDALFDENLNRNRATESLIRRFEAKLEELELEIMDPAGLDPIDFLKFCGRCGFKDNERIKKAILQNALFRGKLIRAGEQSEDFQDDDPPTDPHRPPAKNDNFNRNKEIVTLKKTGKSHEKVAQILRSKYPDITEDVVKGVWSRFRKKGVATP